MAPQFQIVNWRLIVKSMASEYSGSPAIASVVTTSTGYVSTDAEQKPLVRVLGEETPNLFEQTGNYLETDTSMGSSAFAFIACDAKVGNMSSLDAPLMEDPLKISRLGTSCGCIVYIRKFGAENSADVGIHLLKTPFECAVCNAKLIDAPSPREDVHFHPVEESHESAVEIQRLSVAGFDKHPKNLEIRSVEKSFECQPCSKRFTSSWHLRRHLQIHTGKKQFECELCPRKFSEASRFHGHLRTHSGERPFECIVCNKTFTEKRFLMRHEGTHSCEKPFECQLCNKKFRLNSLLREHSMTHLEEKPFECILCNRKFRQESSLRKHITTHTGEKPFECLVCNKKFARRPDLTSHLRLHSGEKPFECKKCNKTFFNRNTLKRHLKTHAGAKPFV